MSDAFGSSVPEPWIPAGAATRRWIPRSGYEFLATITQRSPAAVQWFALRVTQLMDLGWTFRGIKRQLVEEAEGEPWENNSTDYGDTT